MLIYSPTLQDRNNNYRIASLFCLYQMSHISLPYLLRSNFRKIMPSIVLTNMDIIHFCICFGSKKTGNGENVGKEN